MSTASQTFASAATASSSQTAVASTPSADPQRVVSNVSTNSSILAHDFRDKQPSLPSRALDDRINDTGRHTPPGGSSDDPTQPPVIPQIDLETPSTAGPTPHESVNKWLPVSNSIPAAAEKPPTTAASPFRALDLDFSSKGFGEELGANNIKFSARGSMLLDGKKVAGTRQIISAKTMPVVREPAPQAQKRESTARRRAATSIADRPQLRQMSTDEEHLSEKVRAFYQIGTDSAPDLDAQLAHAKRMNLRWQDATSENRNSQLSSISRATSMTDVSRMPSSPIIPREDNELAGGVEDWQDVNNADVDRYGFIIPKSPPVPAQDAPSGVKKTASGSGPGLQRVSTSLQLAAETPRRRITVRRSPSNARSTRSDYDLHRSPSQQSLRSTKSATIYRHHSTSRAIANRLPHNRDRRVLDEASDMLTTPRSSTSNTLDRTLTDEGMGTSTTASTYIPSSTPQSRRKEIERQEKWRKMAHPVPSQPGVVGGGMTFTFDTTSSKLIERTWKGVPDTWRATAWHCFLSASVAKYNKRHPNKPCLSDEDLVDMFHAYQERGSPDDVQIDIDVPRTISSHIMFRRRYRGGQRLLFRVLHAMSMHFADTGYVQGMAALAATLLAYYEEEKAFIMLVRLWELRGLEKLYKHGFGGLIEALDDFEKGWLGQGELRKKLDELMIGPTAYGTRWYLTLFNYSIPFPSQLRVWDVFMLLGDDESEAPPAPPDDEKKDERANFGTTLDVLHATSAALIDGMRDILLESDFENAMKVLTSWIPVRDEDLFMRVAKAEWKMNIQRRANKKKP